MQAGLHSYDAAISTNNACASFNSRFLRRSFLNQWWKQDQILKIKTIQDQSNKTKTKIAACKTKTETDFFLVSDRFVLRPTVSDHINELNGEKNVKNGEILLKVIEQ